MRQVELAAEDSRLSRGCAAAEAQFWSGALLSAIDLWQHSLQAGSGGE